jgi:sugar O-acyltransferase (sialic acid O-acetyltransferase NeuD family)
MTSLSGAENRIGIVGAGGLGKEVLCCFGELFGWKDLNTRVTFLVEDEFLNQDSLFGIDVLPLARHIQDYSRIVIAIGDLKARIRIKGLFPSSTSFETVIHPGVIQTPFTHIGEGSIVLGNSFLSCDVHIGCFAIINPGTTISHDTLIGDYFTASPGVNISGQCLLGERVFMGTNSCTRNAITIGDDVIIGMGAVVVKSILQPGMYVGNPAGLI